MKKKKRYRGRIVVDFNFLVDEQEDVYERIQDDLLDEDYDIKYIDITDEEDELDWEDNYGN